MDRWAWHDLVETSQTHRGLQDERRRRRRRRNSIILTTDFLRYLIKVTVYLHNNIVITLLYKNIIIITINDLLVRHVSTYIDHLQVIVKGSEVLACLLHLHVSCC
jgi:hypothetical protein